ncbi:fibroblast growth factor receptor-like 1 isoform X2 [Tachypleus tridentatus]|uniref:fibroblast growth factor receptor-like 1 isoform X2 n=1 Tax=Tachypleus tridentatus TaxID=6853 RepID=UPI003FCF937C
MKSQLFLLVTISVFQPYETHLQGPPILLDMVSSKELRVEAGSKAVLPCPVDGEKDLVFFEWYKDYRLLDTFGGRRYRVSRSGTLKIRNTTPGDTGRYICKAVNGFGTVETSIALVVYGAKASKPELAGNHPINTTVEYGRTATFQCRVRSQVTPHIQWLKKISKTDRQTDANSKNVVRINGQYFQILTSSEVSKKPDGLFLHKLQIPAARESDTGQYLCLGANTLGYSYRSAFLTVMPKPKSYNLRKEELNEWTNKPDVLLISLPITMGVAIGGFSLLLVACHRLKSLKTTKKKRSGGKSKDSIIPVQRQLSDSETEVSRRLRSGVANLLTSEHWSSNCYNAKYQDVKLTTFSEGTSHVVPSEAVVRGESVMTRLYSNPFASLPFDEEVVYVPIDTV